MKGFLLDAHLPQALTGEDHGGLVLIPTLTRHSPGTVGRKLVELAREQDDWANVVIWLG